MLFQEHLCEIIHIIMEQGHKIILGIDINDDIRYSICSKMVEDIRMKETMINFHKNKSPPAMHNRNKTQKQIDSIWTSPGIETISCRFLLFHDKKGFTSDHRLVWADLCNKSLFGYRSQRIFRDIRSKVRSNNPILREKYINRVIKMYKTKKVF